MSSDKTESSSRMAYPSAAVLYTEGVLFRHIVVGTDFSIHAARAVDIAISLAQVFEANLTLVHAVSPTVFDIDGRQAFREVIAAGRDADEEELQQLVGRTPGLKELRPRTVVEYGEPTKVIQRVAREGNADLIILGSHGASGLERLALGSVAEAILRSTMSPVMIIGPECEIEQRLFRAILFATDLKTTGASAAQYAASLAEQFHGELTILHVQNRNFLSSRFSYEHFRDRFRRRLTALLPAGIDQFCKINIRCELGNPSTAIIAAALEGSASLVILGARDRKLSDHAPWSTFSHIVRDVKCPVLGIKDSAVLDITGCHRRWIP
ncbi:universal stress protein [Edaphobacter sp. 12200R-103]|uniref:universal stress protein n=1 Tax=Edaphobacter sp. 12200R-103 TaxID=2703788 RepID=UPI00138B2F8F|nr:universal stress protein [Edaphobacter sp. 12200R-103]QHS50987.1 universal stress protein [Edaphobacter sp. 12200R-103]